MKNKLKSLLLLALCLPMMTVNLLASSHREAPLIADDPTADNVDVYAFRSPDNPNTVTLIATYIPMQLPFGGPNYYNFDPSVRYEIHVDNDVNTPGDDIIYRFTFTQVNEDPTTFFNIRLGKQNLKTTYKLEKITASGTQVIVANGIVPPNNIGPRSIQGGAGLNTSYNSLFKGAITTTSTGAKVFAGPTDDPFFVDLGGVFDLGDAPRQNGTIRDDLACLNVHALAIQVPIANLSKTGTNTPTNILDGDYTIGVWASASRPKMTVFSTTGDPVHSGEYVQVSRLGMPLTNEVVIPIGQKDFWNAISPYDEISETTLDEYFYNPELALYMDDDQFGGAVPAFAPLRIQTKSLGVFDFSNGADGLFGLKGSPAVAGTALDDAIFGTLLLPAPGKPRSVDLWPAFHTGVPNVIPYQLATGKAGNPLAAGKPFVNNFLPNGGDMLRLNMAVPVTPRSDPNFSSLGLVQAAAIGLTVAPFNTRPDLEFIPNMDGFPNGRRLEDDVTRIELQAVSGVVLAAIGLWYDDFDPMTSPSPVTEDLLGVLTYTTGVETNDKAFSNGFPFLAQPHSGTGECSGTIIQPVAPPPPPPPPAVTCATPTNIQVELRNPRVTRLSWDRTEGAERYILQIRFKGMNRWLLTARVRNNKVFVHGPTNKTYEFRIAAVCNGQPGDYSEIMEYTTSDDLVSPITAQSRSKENLDGESVFIDVADVKVFPNPATDNLTVQYQARATGVLSLFHVSGVQVKTLPLTTENSTYNLDMSDLANGYYLLRIEEVGALPVTQRVIKQATR